MLIEVEYNRCLCGQMIHTEKVECIECEKDGYVCPHCGVDKHGFLAEIKRKDQRIAELEADRLKMEGLLKQAKTMLMAAGYALSKCTPYGDWFNSVQQTREGIKSMLNCLDKSKEVGVE